MKTISERTKLIFAKEIILIFSGLIILGLIGIFMLLSNKYHVSRIENLKEQIAIENIFRDSLVVNSPLPKDTCVYLYNEDTVNVYVVDLIQFIKQYPSVKYIGILAATNEPVNIPYTVPILHDTDVYDIPTIEVSEFLSRYPDSEYFPIVKSSDSWIYYKKLVRESNLKSLEIQEAEKNIYSISRIKNDIYISAIILFSLVYPLRFILYLLSWSFTILKKNKKNSI